MVDGSTISAWLPYITERLGREPRGLRDIVAWDSSGRPAVIQVAPLVDGKPFPTLFWLIDPELTLAIDRLEAGGAIARLQKRVDESPDLRAAMLADHEKHKSLRRSKMTPEEREFLEASGMMAAFTRRGIGGIGEPSRIRCLHTWYAAHWVQPNTIGMLVDQMLAGTDCPDSVSFEMS